MSLAKPKNIRMLEGNPGHRPIPNTPESNSGFGEAPEFLDAIGKEEWYRLGAELDRLGLLTILDRTMFIAWCRYFSVWRQCQLKKISTASKSRTKKKSNDTQINQKFWAELKVFDKLMAIGKRFGLDPVSRMSLATPKIENEEDELEKMLK